MTKKSNGKSKKTQTRKKRNRISHKKHNKTNKISIKNTTHMDFNSNDGMLTSVWGPALWHYLHSMSFNYPNNPTKFQKTKYKKFITDLQYTLPCKYCRMNLTKNFKALPLLDKHMKDRLTFSKYVYNLHEHINHMLCKKSGLTFEDIQNRYENFRARCTDKDIKQKTWKMNNINKTKKKKKENGCVKPFMVKSQSALLKLCHSKINVNLFKCQKRVRINPEL